MPDPIQASRRVDDLFEDLKDGHSLLSLLEVLSGEYLPREKGRMRFHQLQNVETVLNFLRSKNVSEHRSRTLEKALLWLNAGYRITGRSPRLI